MSPSTYKKFRSIEKINISTEANKIPTLPLSYLTQTELANKVKELLSRFDENSSIYDEIFDKHKFSLEHIKMKWLPSLLKIYPLKISLIPNSRTSLINLITVLNNQKKN